MAAVTRRTPETHRRLSELRGEICKLASVETD
jgi:hypothetical protein